MSAIDQCDQSEEIKNYCKEYAKNPSGFILFSGNNGTGKTFLSHAIIADTNIDDTDYKLLISQSELNLKWQNHFKSVDPNAVNYLLNQLKKLKILVLDDIGTRIPSEAFMDFLYALIDYRNNHKSTCGTIITTNLNAIEMRAKFGDAFLSRVGSGKIFKFVGKDRRAIDF